MTCEKRQMKEEEEEEEEEERMKERRRAGLALGSGCACYGGLALAASLSARL